MKSIVIALLLMPVCLPPVASAGVAGDAPAVPDTSSIRPTVEAVRVTNPIVVDGVLSEGDYQRPGITRFTQRDPNEGGAPTQQTEVWLSYDDARRPTRGARPSSSQRT